MGWNEDGTTATNLALGGEAEHFAARRRQMIREQLTSPGRNLTNPRVLSAMSTVPRHEFVPEAQRPIAYEDRALPFGYGQTISQPYIVGLMTEQLDPQPTDRVLEIGTGSGYQAAVLAQLVKEVFTIEIIEPLAQRAAVELRRLGNANISTRFGDGYQGWPDAAPFDAIIVTCAPDNVPPPLIDQLKHTGRMIIPIGTPDKQELMLLRKRGGKLETASLLPVHFVPMTGQARPHRP